MHKITIAITFLMLCFMQNIHAQKFKASLILGTNISQIDGDSLYGFKKLGLTTGGRLSYTNNKTFDLALEMLYSQRGSSVKLFSKQANEKIPLNFLEIPVVVSLRDWYIEKGGYYKVRAEGGLSYGYLFNASSSKYDVTKFGKSDLSWLLGVGINLNKKIGIAARYTSSFIDIYKDTPDLVYFKSYFITLRTEVHL